VTVSSQVYDVVCLKKALFLHGELVLKTSAGAIFLLKKPDKDHAAFLGEAACLGKPVVRVSWGCLRSSTECSGRDP
jgi:hypothetical protein